MSAGTLVPSARAATIKVAGIHGSPVENAGNSVLHTALQQAAKEGVIEYVFSEGVFGTWNHDGAYLTGMLAGKMSKSNVVDSVGAMPIPEVNMLINSFGAGVKAVNPQAKHLVSFIDTFFDPPKAREAGLAQIDAGADILFGERIGTADAAKERGIKAVGSLIDYTPRYPDTVFANALWGFRPILNAALADVAAGKPVGRDYTAYGLLKEGGSDILFVKGVAPAEAEAAMEAKRAEIKAGSFTVPQNMAEPK